MDHRALSIRHRFPFLQKNQFVPFGLEDRGGLVHRIVSILVDRPFEMGYLQILRVLDGVPDRGALDRAGSCNGEALQTIYPENKSPKLYAES